jgi:hypothetical protein
MSRTAAAGWSAALVVRAAAIDSRLVDSGWISAAEVRFTLALHAALALDLRAPLLLSPQAMGSPSAGLAWRVYGQERDTRTELFATLRLYAPVAPDSGSEANAAAALGTLLPFEAPAWERRYTVAPGFAYSFTARWYAIHAEVAISTGAWGEGTPRVEVGYLLAFAARAASPLEFFGELAGRALAHGSNAESRNLIGVAAGLRLRASWFSAALGVRIPLGDARNTASVLPEIAIEGRF